MRNHHFVNQNLLKHVAQGKGGKVCFTNKSQILLNLTFSPSPKKINPFFFLRRKKKKKKPLFFRSTCNHHFSTKLYSSMLHEGKGAKFVFQTNLKFYSISHSHPTPRNRDFFFFLVKEIREAREARKHQDRRPAVHAPPPAVSSAS
jgi:hypothetical protein